MFLTGPVLLHEVAQRILKSWLVAQGRVDVQTTEGRDSVAGRQVDLVHAWQGSRNRIKVKADQYFGVDPAKINDRALSFYREDAHSYAFEAVSNAATREPGWIFESMADEIYYYYLAIGQPEDEVRALLSEPDEVFMSELAVDRDELVILPMGATRTWFETNYERYTPRPVLIAGASAWYRLVPRADIEGAVQGIKRVGPVLRSLSR